MLKFLFMRPAAAAAPRRFEERQLDDAQKHRQQPRRAGKLQAQRSESQQVSIDAVLLPDRRRRGQGLYHLRPPRPPNLPARFRCSGVRNSSEPKARAAFFFRAPGQKS